MPNIKIYGIVRDINGDKELDKAAIISNKIDDIFKGESWYDDTVITIIPSIVYDFNTNKQPYLQLEFDCKKNYKKIVEKLKTLGYDIQVVKLHDFIQKE